ncbi:sensor domain-containing diguanylate cyclase [Novosphingobium sp. 9]|uniref:sensor domain-containing diguanylate cyclase n=1 Tax=Novosphingobium sp. 9 TaxID=2025349 RepID=UPI0028CB6132|nr:sensor domain-containing diguanylate cyclase [Novosphingobium sp. 9]
MIEDTKLQDEAGRLGALRRLDVLDTAPEEPFDNIVQLVRSVLSVPMALVTLLDEDRQWFKARRGLEACETAREISFCTYGIQHREPFMIPDAQIDARFAENPLVTGNPNIRSYLGIPLETPDGYNVGMLCAIDTHARNYKDSEIDLMRGFARLVMKEFELRTAAIRDPLTGAHSRRGFLDRAEQERERFARYGGPGCMVMIDIDHFKAVNDTHGHRAGDIVLREVAQRLNADKRPSDVFGRLGGEEFAMMLPETSAADARIVTERFRKVVEDMAIDIGGGKTLNVTASFGIAPLDTLFDSAEDWIAAADEPLYLAKRGGRNRWMMRGES